MTQFDLLGNEVEIKPKPTNKAKRNWENAFQSWSNKAGFRENITEPYGVCGYGSMCDYCEDNTHGRPCVRALNEMCREKHITIDYTDRNFEDVWCGEFNRRSDTNDHRDRLIHRIMSLNKPTISLQTAMDIVEAIIDMGIIVPIADGNGVFHSDVIGKTVFLTKEEAEKKLKELKDND